MGELGSRFPKAAYVLMHNEVWGEIRSFTLPQSISIEKLYWI